MSDQPLPVIALQYHHGDEHVGWWAVVRLLAVLSIIGDTLGGGFAAYSGWMNDLRRASYLKVGYAGGWLNFVVLMSGVVLAIDMLHVVGAVGCLRHSDAFRRFTVGCSWTKVGVSLLAIVANVGLQASARSMVIWATILYAFGSLSGSTLMPIAMAMLLSRPEVKRAFAMRAMPAAQR
jgi:hypothetical protein